VSLCVVTFFKELLWKFNGICDVYPSPSIEKVHEDSLSSVPLAVAYLEHLLLVEKDLCSSARNQIWRLREDLETCMAREH
jgi:hypothetical protein